MSNATGIHLQTGNAGKLAWKYTRAATSDKLHRKYSRLKQQTDRLLRACWRKLWNEIPVDLRELTKSSFKAKINNMLFQVLENEDIYVDVPTLIKTIKLLRNVEDST